MKNLLFLLMTLAFMACSADDFQPDDNFKDEPDDIVYTIAEPCTSATSDCLESIRLTSEDGRVGNFSFYQNYPILNDTAIWGNIKNAVIVIHGNNRDADNYFNFINNSITQIGLKDSTLIISPYFKNNTQAGPGDLFWNNGWRKGDLSGNPSVKISTFSILDSLLTTIANKDQFPFLNKIILAGHSSGAIFTQAYAFAKDMVETWDFDVDYVVANSQYFYYPQDLRYNETTSNFLTPSNCPNFNHWPYGFDELNEYLTATSASREALNERFIKKKITYLLGTNDTVTSGTLNTTDCAAVLLGEHRFNRGENMYLFMETFYPDIHNHQKILVNNVGHNGQAMFGSISFRNLMSSKFKN